MDKPMTLVELRRMQNLCQHDLADRLHIGREAISNRERKTVSSQGLRGLLDYAYALGGHLELWVVIDGKKYELQVDE